MIDVRIFRRATVCRQRTGFVRALIDARADALVVVKHSFFGNPRIANAVAIDVRISKRAAVVLDRAVLRRALIDALALLHVRVGRIFEEIAETLFRHPRIAETVAIDVRIGPRTTLVRYGSRFARAHVIALADIRKVSQAAFIRHPRRADRVAIRVRILARATVERRETGLVRAFVDTGADSGKLV